MLSRRLAQASSWRRCSTSFTCASLSQAPTVQRRSFAATAILLKNDPAKTRRRGARSVEAASNIAGNQDGGHEAVTKSSVGESANTDGAGNFVKDEVQSADDEALELKGKPRLNSEEKGLSLKDALLGTKRERKKRKKKKGDESLQPSEPLEISTLYPDDLQFVPVKVDIPPVPMLSYGLDRVLFNPGVYRLQDARSRVFNFDPYLEKIMPVHEFDFDALSEYKTSSKDTELLAITKNQGTRFTGSTSSMSGILQHFHYLLSGFRTLNHSMLSREFPDPSAKYSRITYGPSAAFLRYKDGVYAIDADKSFDRPNIMSWLGHSLEKLLTTSRDEFERYRKSSPTRAPAEDDSSRCYHYSKQGNLLMRSQLDAVDPRLPGTGIFDLKTRAVVSIRMNHTQHEEGQGYQIRHSRGQWESFEREFYDMTRSTMLKYSLQVRMGRMDGIFVAYHNIERIFGFQYLSLPDMDTVIHGQADTRLGDQEFKLSVALLDELLVRATTRFPDSSLRLHFESRDGKTPFMYIFAEPVTEEQADAIQSAGEAQQKAFAQNVIGVGKSDPEVQEAWQNFRDDVDQQIEDDQEASQESGFEENSASPLAKENFAELHKENELTTENSHKGYLDEKVTSEDDANEEATTGEATINEDTKDEPINEEASNSETTTEEALNGVATNREERAGPPDSSSADCASADPPEDGPLVGWILTVRSKVNGEYVDRPTDLQGSDDWKIEYHIQEVQESKLREMYMKVKERRRLLIGQDDEEVNKNLKHYRETIQRYTQRGREWRQQQDEMDRAKDVQLYKPLGPRSEVSPTSENSSIEPASMQADEPTDGEAR